MHIDTAKKDFCQDLIFKDQLLSSAERKQRRQTIKTEKNWGWRHGSSGRMLALQVQGPEFKPQH
jgi:hypothetical protein